MPAFQRTGYRSAIDVLNRKSASAAAVVAAFAMAGCTVPQPQQQPAQPDEIRCAATAPGDAMVGSWLSVRKQSGVAGELRTHIVLQADGTMNYEEQLSRPGKAPQGLRETGCWQRDGQVLVLRTLESNGSPVDTGDPIYVNRYQVTQQAGARLGLQASGGVRLDAKRMPPDYRLPL